ncbi:hypothetical protein U27_00960 [Candidatus Vecturithrix granuli]|uniref:TIR domain-containing protein n=1 Tax=Vecturithrix granuli TaxID=1499967 RepID=A0A081C907_VECG1|nr:hypothetical protein U27_00960 [Candidatus Vecturithrix granuli]
MSEPKQWDLFISHASEDNEEVALPLAELLEKYGVRVWLDQKEIRLGDSIPAKINQGLSKLRVGLVIAR